MREKARNKMREGGRLENRMESNAEIEDFKFTVNAKEEAVEIWGVVKLRSLL